MKRLAQYWWIALILTAILYLFNHSAWEKVHEYEAYYGGWEGVAEGYLSGLIGDFNKIDRVETRYMALLDKAEFWQTLFRLSLLVTIILGIVAAKNAIQRG